MKITLSGPFELRSTWVLVAALPLLLAVRSYPFLHGFDVMQHWTAWDYVSVYCQDLVLWGTLAAIWFGFAWRKQSWAVPAMLIFCNLALVAQIIDSRTKMLFLQPLSLGLIDFGVGEFNFLAAQAKLFFGVNYWKGALAAVVCLNGALLLPSILKRIRGEREVAAAPKLSRALIPSTLAVGVVGMLCTVPKAYGLHKNFFVDIVTGVLEGDVPGLYDHEQRPTSEPARTLKAADYAHSTRPAFAAAKGMNVVLYILESTSYQRTSFGDPEANRTPFMAELKERGAFVAPCYTHFAASTKSMFILQSGLYSSPTQEVLSTQVEDISGLVRTLKDRGYYAEFCSAQNLNYQGTRRQFKSMGYDVVRGSQDLQAIAESRGIEYVADGMGSNDDRMMLLPGLEEFKAKQPFLATYYTTSSHYPYMFPGCKPGSDESRHEQSLTYSDKVIREVCDLLKKHELDSNTMVIVTSDHGEHFTNGKFKGRGTTLSEHAHLVPLLIYVPGMNLTNQKAGNARHIDVVPTLFDLLGVTDTTTRLQGRSLFADTRELPTRLFSIGVVRRGAKVFRGHKILSNIQTGQSWFVDLRKHPSGNPLTPFDGADATGVVDELKQFGEYNEALLRDWIRSQK